MKSEWRNTIFALLMLLVLCITHTSAFAATGTDPEPRNHFLFTTWLLHFLGR